MLDDLKDQYKKSLTGKIEAIKSHLRDFRQGDADAEKNLRLMAHSLAGSGSTYGFPDISTAARNVENASKEDFLKKLTVLITVLHDVSIAEDDREEDDASRPGPKKILIIEDDKDISNLLKVVLSQKLPQVSIDVTETAQDAERRLQHLDYSMVILDLVLPDRDGREVLKTIRSGKNASVPICVLSSMDNDKIQNECRTLGASHFYNKPFDPEVIATRIVEIFTGDEPAEATSAGRRKSSGRLLVAEDDELLARIILHRLSREGLSIDHVENGSDALDAMKKNVYDLVILDVKMPVIDGFEVLERFRRDLGQNDVPVVMLTAMGSEKDIVRGYDLGATDYILKPFSPVELIARVKSLLRDGGD